MRTNHIKAQQTMILKEIERLKNQLEDLGYEEKEILKIEELKKETNFSQMDYKTLMTYYIKVLEPEYYNKDFKELREEWGIAYKVFKDKRTLRDKEVQKLVEDYIKELNPNILCEQDIIVSHLYPEIREIYEEITPFDCESEQYDCDSDFRDWERRIFLAISRNMKLPKRFISKKVLHLG